MRFYGRWDVTQGKNSRDSASSLARFFGRFLELRQCFDQLDQFLPQDLVPDFEVGAHQTESFAFHHGNLIDIGPTSFPLSPPRRSLDVNPLPWRVLEEEDNWYVQDPGKRVQSPGGYPIRSLFILLNLLERAPNGLSQLFLGQPEHHAAKPDTLPDMPVDRVRSAHLYLGFWHSLSDLPVASRACDIINYFRMVKLLHEHWESQTSFS